MRGKDKPDEKKFTFGRITPACAGKSAVHSEATQHSRDHPRVCGEKGYITKKFDDETGSPPRVRGKAAKNKTAQQKERITPACAGKSRALAVYEEC